MPYRSGRHFLHIPGPITNVPDRILRTIHWPTIDHRGPTFSQPALEMLAGIPHGDGLLAALDFLTNRQSAAVVAS